MDLKQHAQHLWKSGYIVTSQSEREQESKRKGQGETSEIKKERSGDRKGARARVRLARLVMMRL